MQRNNVRDISKHKCFGILCILIIVVASIICGCANRHAVVAVTGTNIGLEISQNPANQTPQAKLGYNRGEVAIVPSNRAANEEPGSQGGGAADVADVIMELKFSNIFSFNTSGIYQRLAVGSTAVRQPGAAFMFAKDQKGNIDSSTAEAINKALSTIPETDANILKARSPLTKAYEKLKSTKEEVFNKAVGTIGYTNYENFVLNKPSQPTAEQVNKVRKELEKDDEIKTLLETFQTS